MASLKKTDHKKVIFPDGKRILRHWFRIAGSLAKSYRAERQHGKGPVP